MWKLIPGMPLLMRLSILFPEKTKAILVVHTYGLPGKSASLIKICEDRKIHIVEDVAEAIGLKLYNQYCGSYGTISTFSFYPNKHVTTGEGGMIPNRRPGNCSKVPSYEKLGLEGKRRFVHHHLAPNYRLTNMQVAIGLAQLEVLEQTIEMKKTMGRTYLELLEGFDFDSASFVEDFLCREHFWVLELYYTIKLASKQIG